MMRRSTWCENAFGKLRLILTSLVALFAIGSPTIVYAVCCLGGPPDTPTGLTGPISDPDGTYTVSWNTSVGATFYELQEQIGGGSWVTVYNSNLHSVSMSTEVVETYTYRVAACTNAEGCSSYSSTIDVDVTGGITTPAVEETDSGDILVGTTPYNIDVAADGDAVISVPLNLIPGVAGFAPSLSVEYDSGRGIDRLEQSLPEDTLGYGWRLAGLSQIRRCVVNQSSGNSIDLDTGDNLCLDGMPFVRESGTHFAVGAIYRTLIESYIKIEIKGSTGALWFEAKIPDGTVQEYGNGGGSRVDDDGGVDFQWSLSKETSGDGNVIDYSYWHDPSAGVNRIAQIDYVDAAVYFEYLDRTDASAVLIDTDSQTQNAFLHTIRVEYDDVLFREYRLLNEVVSSRWRLHKIQHCGYDENGANGKCLAPLDFTWWTPSTTLAGVPIAVDGMMDGLYANHTIEYGTITGSSHSFLFTERPFGDGTEPDDTQLLSGTGGEPLRYVVTKLLRDDGLVDTVPVNDEDSHVTTYAYQNKGIESTKHWGFLGFYAQRITDEQSDIVSYAQYRMDYPYFGRVARLHQLDDVYGSETLTLTRSENDYDQETISHGSNDSVYPFVDNSIDFFYEGTTQLGATSTSNVPSVVSGLITQVVSTSKTGTSVSNGSSGSTWGDIPTYTVTDLENTTKSTVEFENRTTSGKWLIGFADDVTREAWAGAESGAGIVQDATMTAHAYSLKPASIEKFPNDSNLSLTNSFVYDSNGRVTSTTVVGDYVNTRTTSFSSFVDDRYMGQSTNAKSQTTSYTFYDSRFGKVRTKGDINNRGTTWFRDPFGRVTSLTTPDGVQTTTTYTDCPTGCSITVYGVSPSFYVKTDSIIAPIQEAYFDSLGRAIRTRTQSLDGTSYSAKDVKYDTQGRVEKASMPYFPGTSEDVVYEYDLRDRIEKVTRPDGSSTETDFSASGSIVIVDITDNVKKEDGTTSDTQVKRNKYNILGQLIETIDGYNSSIDPKTTYTYDANSNVLTAAVTDGTNTNTTTFEYDDAGNQEKVIGPNIGSVINTYTGLNEVKTRKDNLNRTSTYTYDVLGRLKSLLNPDGTSTWTWDTATYGKGKLKSRSNTGFTETYSYNSDSQLSSAVTNITPIGGSSGTDYTTSHTYDTYERPSTTTYPGGFVLTRSYNTYGFLTQLKDGGTAIQTIYDLDAFGNSIDESYGNGVDTVRVYDPETGRLRDIDTTDGATVFQNNEYDWRSNGTLESRLANPATGLSGTRKELYEYDVLNRVKKAETFINSSNTRDLDYTYSELGNITSKTSTLSGDTDVASYVYGAGTAGPHALTSASIDGVSHTLEYELGSTFQNGEVVKYEISGTDDDKYLAYNANNQPTKIVVGTSLTDSSPVARDEFAYDPNGRRYARKTTWEDGANTYTEEVAYIGAVEYITDDSGGSTQTIAKTLISGNVMHVNFVGPLTDNFFEYAHRDHLDSIEVVTDENGDVLDNLAIENFGSRKKKDWTANISTSELEAILDVDTDHSRKARGFTNHEHLDRTGFIHMNGRIYDPVLGRFLSPDPFVQFPAFSQGWNRYSYVSNAPTSSTDPTGYVQEATGMIGTTNATGYGGTAGDYASNRANSLHGAMLGGAGPATSRGDMSSVYSSLPQDPFPGISQGGRPMQQVAIVDDPSYVDISIRTENFERAQQIFGELYEIGSLPQYEFIEDFEGGLNNKAFSIRVTDIDSPYGDFRDAEMDTIGYTGATIFRDGGKTLEKALNTVGHEYFHLETINQQLWNSGDPAQQMSAQAQAIRNGRRVVEAWLANGGQLSE